MKMMDANEIISFIQKSEKKTPVKVYIKGDLKEVTFPETVQAFVNKKSGVLFGEWSEIKTILDENNKHIVDYVVENDRRNSAIPMLDLKGIKARIEPGAIIRDHVEIGDNGSVLSVKDLDEISNSKMPAKSKRRPRSEKNTVSLDIWEV